MRLSEKLEAADAGSRELDAEIAVAFGYERDGDEFWLGDEFYSIAEPDYYASAGQSRELPAFSTSIDAALTLLPDGWGVTYVSHPMPKCTWAAVREYTKDKDGVSWTGKSNRQSGEIHASTPALALCAAICRAKGEG